MMRALSAYESPMVPKHLLEGQDVRNADLANNPVGTGPFKFVEWKKGQYIRLDKNEDYWQEGKPYLDKAGRPLHSRCLDPHGSHGERRGALRCLRRDPECRRAVRLREMDSIGVTTDGYAR